MNIKSEKEFYGEELKRVALRFNADIFVWGEELISRKLIIYPKKLKDVMVYTFYQVKEESIKSRFDGKIIKGMMDILSG